MPYLFVLLAFIACAAGCKSQPEKEVKSPAIVVSEGTYEAVVDDSNVEDDLKAYHQTSKIGFSFEANQRFVYMVRAMGREIDDVGKWEIRGDSLYIFDLERGPNSAFHIQPVGTDQYRISGPNTFTLRKVADAAGTLKN